MNKLEKMSYKGYSFATNPSVIKIRHRARVTKNSVPFQAENTVSFGRKACEISGEGELVGYDCEKQFAEIRKLFLSGVSGLLLLPGIEPFYAFFQNFELLEEPSDSLIKYSFSFCEDTSAKHFEVQTPKSYIAKGGESLWDISYDNNIVVEELLEKNPNVMRPDLAFDAGEVIRL